MYRLIRTKPVFTMVILTLSLLVAACSPSAEKLNKDGNSAYAKQAYEEALSAYQFAQIESPELAEPYYNAANSLYKQGMYAEALEQISQALSFAKEETLVENSFYNLGNSSFSTQEWENSIAAYTEALLLNPDDLDAKYNLELALQQLQQQEQQEEQEQDQEQNQDQEQSQDSEDGENENKDQDQDQSQSEGDQGEQEQDSQSSDQGENQDDQSENDENQEDSSDQNSDEHNQDQSGEQGQPQDNDAENQEQPSQSGQVPPPGQRMTEEQAKQLLAALAQDMQTLQERLGQILFAQELPPIQDW
ncbi:hypothetical protein ACFLV7_07280 [Chloroflexota bacterium]